MKKILALLGIVLLIGLPLLAVAQPADAPTADTAAATPAEAIPAAAEGAAAVPTEPPGPDIDLDKAAEGMLEGINTSKVTLIVGAGLMLVVLIIRKFVWKKLQDKTEWLPWVAVGIAVAGTVGIALVADPVRWLDALLAGAQAGIGAAGTWGLLKVARNKLKKPK